MTFVKNFENFCVTESQGTLRGLRSTPFVTGCRGPASQPG